MLCYAMHASILSCLSLSLSLSLSLNNNNNTQSTPSCHDDLFDQPIHLARKRQLVTNSLSVCHPRAHPPTHACGRISSKLS
ncbi:hypothetical protein IWX46DRAFT_614840 [Phyllosticta citricarpa]|uniref:Secreted protein n=1 Tax=Phyllosticta citricarpa TaxID=55181 RepID=A0ABR1LBA7_9PEZI